ncbi:hypothetical protein [Haladaptatus sp. CMSO5]|uniref:hypothetical protein n=1 Tax=Haladaptatus sp. CMSO5 TaxID=3120514 RepID=UPI002FCE048B
MPSRTFAFFLILICVGFAGCTDDPFSSIVGGEKEPTLETVTFPKGTTAQGFTNRSQLVNSTKSGLDGTTFTMTDFITNSNAENTWTSAKYLESDREGLVVYQWEKAGGQTDETYIDSTGVYYKFGTEPPTYRTEPLGWVTPREVHERGIERSTQYLEAALELGNYTAADVIRRDGTTLIVYNLTDPADTADDWRITAASGQIFVDQQGIVHKIDIYIAGRSVGESSTYTRTRLRYSVFLNEPRTVREPAWVANQTER